MWSHYANNHTGAALGFKANASIGRASKVNYDEGNSLLDTFVKNVFQRLLQAIVNKENDESITKIASKRTLDIFFKYFFLKKKEWSYENEYRIALAVNSPKINTQDGVDLIKFDKQDLVSITFGINTGEKDFNHLSNLIKNTYPDILVQRAHKDGWNLKI